MTVQTSKTALVYADQNAPTVATCVNIVQIWIMQTFGNLPEKFDIQNYRVSFELFGYRVEIADHRTALNAAWADFWGIEAQGLEIDLPGTMTTLEVADIAGPDSIQAPRPATLADMLDGLSRALARHARPDAVAWTRPDHWLDATRFFDVAHSVRPRRARLSGPARPRPVRRPGQGVHIPLSDTYVATRHRLACRTKGQFRSHERALRELRLWEDDTATGALPRGGNGAQRIKAWTLTTTVTIIAPPVGAALACANLAGGATYRTAAHMMALTGLLVALSQQGGLAQALFQAVS